MEQRWSTAKTLFRIDLGDTITWNPNQKGHNVHFIAGPRRLGIKKSKNNKEVSITFDTPVYICINAHPCKHGYDCTCSCRRRHINPDAIAGYKARGKSKKKLNPKRIHNA